VTPLEQLNNLKLSLKARREQERAQAAAEANAKRQRDELELTEALTYFLTEAGADWFLAFLSPRAEDADTRFPTVYFNPPEHAAILIDFRRSVTGAYTLANKDKPWCSVGCNFSSLAEALVAAEGRQDDTDF